MRKVVRALTIFFIQVGILISCNKDKPFLPIVNTTNVTAITQTSAASGGEITSDGGAGITSRGVCWSTSHNPTIIDDITTNGTGGGIFTSAITGLTLNTTYYVRAYATNTAGTAYGNEVSFKTDPSTLPVLITLPATSITQTSANSGGTITDIGGSPISLRGLCWSTTSNPTTANNKTDNGSGQGTFTALISGLDLNTKYYVRAYAVNDAGTGYGNEINFTTSTALLAELTTLEATSITQTSAISGGEITSNGGSPVTDRGLCWNTTHIPTIYDYLTSDGEGPGAFSSLMTGLTLNTTYYARAYAINGAGVAYGNEISFTTSPALQPELTTTPISGITQISASSGGTITSDGGSAIVSRGVCWSETPTPTVNDNKTSDGSGPGVFSSAITGLTLNTTYYVRAYATNIAGTAYGDELSFTTDPANLPTVFTSSVTNVTQTSATCGGTITADGGSAISIRGICWSTSPNPTTGDNKTNDGSGPGTFSSLMTGLALNTTYYVRAYATNMAGTAYGNELAFSTNPANLPVLTTASVTSITQTSAITGGSITSDGGSAITARGVCWSNLHNPTIANYKTTDGTGPGVFSSLLTGLSLNTTYYVRAYAINAAGIAYGNEVSFTTDAPTLPVLTTSDITGITQTTAFSGGSITDNGGASITARGVCWSTSQNPTILNSKTSDGTGPGTFSSYITGLSLNTTYYVRAYATNSSGTGYGNQVSFTTNPATLAELTTVDVSSITQTTAISGGSITGTGGDVITARGVCWSTSPGPTTSGNKTSDGSGPGVFSSFITGLTLNTTYYVRAYAVNSAGTAYGNEVSFSTAPANLPVLTTTDASSITQTSAITGGSITDAGGGTITARGVCWSTSPNPTTTNSKTSDGTGLGTFSSYITGLTLNTTYYVRAYATNASGTAYGNQISFTTNPATLPVLTTAAINSITQTSAASGGTITDNGGAAITARGVCWSTAPNPTTADNYTSNGTGPGAYTSFISGLVLNTTYYVRAYAINVAGTAYGDELSFTTSPATVPVLTTSDVTSITQISAVCGGTITDDGGSPITGRGLCWSTTPNPSTSDNITNNGSGPGSFATSITGLIAGTLYYVKAYAINSAGTAYGNEVSFTTSAATLAVLTTSEITSITQTSAVSGGTITADGGSPITYRGICWNTSPNPTTDNSGTINGSGPGAFTSLMTGLILNTTYYVRAYAINAAGTAYGNELNFTTNPATLPVLTTTPVTSITQTTAVSGGNITDNGGVPITARGVCWSTSPNPTIDNSGTTDGSGPGTYTSLMTGLSPGTTYYLRAYATNSAGTGYGNEISFTTSQ